MPEPFVIGLLIVATAALASAATVVFSRRRTRTPTAAVTIAADGALRSVGPDGSTDDPPDAEARILALRTTQPNQIYLFGPSAELDEIGTTLVSAPPQLTRYTSGLNAAGNAARSAVEMSGRLVLVDDKTAAALKAGTMMRDTGGEILALTRGADGKIASVARLRQVGGIAAGVASMTNAMSAMALQAQLDRIERQLSAISSQVDSVNRELLREWHASTRGAQDMLREVYTTAAKAGELSPANWNQIASLGQVIRTQMHGDRDRLSSKVDELERLTAVKDLKKREKAVKEKVDAVQHAHAALTESTRAWAQYSALRLWHFNVTGDSALEGYRQELERFVKSSHDDIGLLRRRALAAARHLGASNRVRRMQHPRAALQLPKTTEDAATKLLEVNWSPLELRQPSKELAVIVRPRQRT